MLLRNNEENSLLKTGYTIVKTITEIEIEGNFLLLSTSFLYTIK
jgi:hypothetical protein